MVPRTIFVSAEMNSGSIENGTWHHFLALLHEEGELGTFAVGEQLVARLLAERLEVFHGAGVGRHDFQYLARVEVAQHFFRPEDGQRTVESAHVELAIERLLLHACGLSEEPMILT